MVKIIKKCFLIFSIVFLFSACVNFSNLNNYSKKNSKLIFFKDNLVVDKISLTNPQLSYFRVSSCVQDAYTLQDLNSEYGKIFYEYIDLRHQCTWRGLPSSFFETSLHFELKLDLLEVVENITIDSYTFKTYRIDSNYYLSVVYFDATYTNSFLIDYEGRLYTKLLKKFNADYKNIYLKEKRYKGDYDKSLVRKNIIEHYFEYQDFRN